MISDGIENCIVAIDNFDPRKSDNPFAYFTMIAWNAFIRRIQREKKQTYIKHKNMQNTFIVDELASEFGMQVTGDQKSDDVIRDFEQKAENNKKKKKKTAKKKGLEIFT
jgi:DNA-directed RNA polymerase specialized sigma24 family protein